MSLAKATPIGAAHPDGLTVLVVEDHADSREAMRLVLETLGARVLVAGDGLEALALLAGDSPDLILCDIRMPRMDGLAFLQRLRAARLLPGVPVVAVSAHRDGHAVTEHGFDAYLDKPVDYRMLSLTLERVRAERAAARRSA